jgi:short-subunit dehydrogenase
MKVRLRRLRDQVVVLTGASSGIGLVTARLAARRGARLVLAARSDEELHRLAGEVAARGGQAVPVAADVGREEDVQRIADAAVERFGGFDTWVNNAGVSIFGRLEEVSIEDMRRLFETNFWGTVYGSLTAVRHLKRRGGALINVGSVVSDRAFPVQGIYSASKHAVKGFTDALRVESEEEGAPVSVTLIKPTSVATPLPRHARNYLPVEPTLPPPVYAPELVAEAILHCAEHPEREVSVGGASRAMSSAAALSPRLMDWYQELTSFRRQRSDRPARGDPEGSLHRPSHDLSERAEYPHRHARETNLYTSSRLHPTATAATLAGAALALGGLWAALCAGHGGEA